MVKFLHDKTVYSEIASNPVQSRGADTLELFELTRAMGFMGGLYD